jgi:hypothetical protein
MLKPYMAGKNVTYEHSVKQERKTHLKNLKNTTSFIVETGQNAPPKQIPSIMANPRKKMKEQERFNAIEAENARLLSRMTKIMDAGPRLSVLHRTKVFISNAPTRRNEALQVAKINQVVLERLNKTGPYYDHKQWARDRKVTEHILGGMGLYPYVPPPAKKADDFFEKDPLSDKTYESKLDEQWAESLSAFASRSNVLDEEFDKQNQGRRAISLTPSSLKRPGNDDWMLPGLGRPGIYSHAKEGKTMQVIPDGRLPYQFSVRTPSPKQKKSLDSIVRPDSIPKNVLIAKPMAPTMELEDNEYMPEDFSGRSSLKSRDGKKTTGSRPTSAARPLSAAANHATAAKAASSRPSSATASDAVEIADGQAPLSENNPNSEVIVARPLSAAANHATAAKEASSRPSSATASDAVEIADGQAPLSENNLSDASFQGSQVVHTTTAHDDEKTNITEENSVPSSSDLSEPEHAGASESAGNTGAEEMQALPSADGAVKIRTAASQEAENVVIAAIDDQPALDDIRQATVGTVESDVIINHPVQVADMTNAKD